jgi:hypothetical protein
MNEEKKENRGVEEDTEIHICDPKVVGTARPGV